MFTIRKDIVIHRHHKGKLSRGETGMIPSLPFLIVYISFKWINFVTKEMQLSSVHVVNIGENGDKIKVTRS